MKKISLVFLLMLPFVLIGQKKLRVVIGNGFEGAKSSLYIVCANKINTPIKNICFEDVLLKDNFVTDISFCLDIELPSKGMKEVIFEIGENNYRFCFNKMKNNSQLKIEMLDGVRFCFIQ